MEALLQPELWMAFITLALLEVVLGIDNIIFLTIITERLPARQRQPARIIGLSLALILRIVLLLSISWIMGLTAELFSVFGQSVSGRDLILLGGGAFLVFKAVREIHNSLELDDSHVHESPTAMSFGIVLFQIGMIDAVFSLDSVITAVGLVDEVGVMIAAIVFAVIVMMLAAAPVARFVENNPPVKMLALAFLVLIGFTLMIEAWGIHVPKGYIYFAMFFTIAVEGLNMLASTRSKVKLRRAQLSDLVRVSD